MVAGTPMIHFPAWLKVKETQLSAHRGAVALAPENTLEAFQQAIANGYGAVEMDVQMSADGELFLLHDATLTRTTDGTGTATEKTWNQLSQLKIKTDRYPQYTGQTLRIPSFESIVSALSNTNLLINVDGSKGDWTNRVYTDKIVALLRKYGKLSDTFFMLTNKSIRDQFLNWYPDAWVSWIYSSANDIDSEIELIQSYPKALISLAYSDATATRLKALDDAKIEYQVHLVDKMHALETVGAYRVRLVETDTILP